MARNLRECFPAATEDSSAGDLAEAVHPDDAAVDALAAKMKAKLAKQRAKGYGGWDTPECSQLHLSAMLRDHVAKGDPVDVANFCAFLVARGEGIQAEVQPKTAELPKGVAQFTKKPVTINAIQWDGKNLYEVISFTQGPPDTRSERAQMAWHDYASIVEREGLQIHTLEGKMLANVGDWIIRGVKGEHYPCKPDIFAVTYEPATAPQAEVQAEPVAEQDQYLCQAWGETDFPAVAIVGGLSGVRSFLIDYWLGSEDAQEDDGTLTLPKVMQEMQNEWAMEGEAWKWSIEFEIGGISVQKVGRAALPAPQAQPADAPIAYLQEPKLYRNGQTRRGRSDG